MNGHLLDKKVLTKALEILESFKIDYQFISINIGDSQSKTDVEIRLKCNNMKAVQEALAAIYDLCEENDI